MPNFGQIISGHNKKILNKIVPNKKTCNCKIQNDCPVQNKCLEKEVIYQASVTRTDTGEIQTYVGLTSNTFKARWANLKTSFNLTSHENETRLSTYIWELKRKNVNFELNWRILAKSKAYSPVSKKCWLCIKEKYFILYGGEAATLNKRNELFTPCIHKEKFKLCKQ